MCLAAGSDVLRGVDIEALVIFKKAVAGAGEFEDVSSLHLGSANIQSDRKVAELRKQKRREPAKQVVPAFLLGDVAVIVSQRRLGKRVTQVGLQPTNWSSTGCTANADAFCRRKALNVLLVVFEEARNETIKNCKHSDLH
ncbi:hypothetical protein ASC96_00765 [Rhizobium sp. Root1204]|nr:hypothetical protein ASC96_00765 [Rhizobium sp. Root1204]